MLESMKKFVKENNMCVLATCLDNQPHCSLMAYVADDEGVTLFMISQAGSKKFKNLLQNPKVSLLIDNRREPSLEINQIQALTVSGLARPVTDLQEAESLRRRIVARHPQLKNLAAQAETRVVAVKALSFLFLKGPEEAYSETTG